jgi:hypothetical protein
MPEPSSVLKVAARTVGEDVVRHLLVDNPSADALH